MRSGDDLESLDRLVEENRVISVPDIYHRQQVRGRFVAKKNAKKVVEEPEDALV